MTAESPVGSTNAIIFWIVTDVKRAALEVASYGDAISWAARTSLRETIDRDSVLGQRLLGDKLGRSKAGVDQRSDVVEDRDDPEQPRPSDREEFARAQDDGLLPLPCHLKCGKHDHRQDDQQPAGHDETGQGNQENTKPG